MVGIVVEENEFLGAAFHDDIYGFAPMAVSPAALLGLVLVRQILRVVDEQVGPFGQLTNVLIKERMSGLVIRSVDQHALFGFDAETQAALRVVEPAGLDNAIVE